MKVTTYTCVCIYHINSSFILHIYNTSIQIPPVPNTARLPTKLNFEFEFIPQIFIFIGIKTDLYYDWLFGFSSNYNIFFLRRSISSI